MSADADVDSFVRLAVDSVHRLVADERLAAELVESADADSSEPLQRLLAAQRVLARVLAYERATLGAALAVEEVFDWLGRRQLDDEEVLRLVYELSLGGGRSWPAIQMARLLSESPESDGPAGGDEAADPRALDEADADLWLRALRLLVRPSQPASSSVDRALARARSRPLGLARLVLELADDQDGISGLAQLLSIFDDPFLRHEAPRESADLRARCALYLADAARRSGRIDEGSEHLDAASTLLAAGTGDPILSAMSHEARAGLDLARGDRDEALRRFSAARELLNTASAPQTANARRRLTEIELKRALVLAGDARKRQEASDALAALADSVAESPAVDPGLRLRVLVASARVEVDLARQSVAEADPLDSNTEAAPEDALASYAGAWSKQSARLDRAAEWLVSAEFWLEAGDERTRSEHRWLSGLSRLLADRREAAAALRGAIADFRRLGDAESVDQISIDLIVCCVLSGALGDEVDDGSEPLELFRQLAARTRSSSEQT